MGDIFLLTKNYCIMKTKILSLVMLFAMSFSVGMSIRAQDDEVYSDEELPEIVVTCSRNCSGDNGGKCWVKNLKGVCVRSEFTTNFCKC